jgi:hypothetical protein
LPPSNILFGSIMPEYTASTPYLECGIDHLLKNKLSIEDKNGILRAKIHYDWKKYEREFNSIVV